MSGYHGYKGMMGGHHEVLYTFVLSAKHSDKVAEIERRTCSVHGRFSHHKLTSTYRLYNTFKGGPVIASAVSIRKFNLLMNMI